MPIAEISIFGALLQRALLPEERFKLGAYYTPPAYVERLVIPTMIEPLRQEWETIKETSSRLAGGILHTKKHRFESLCFSF